MKQIVAILSLLLFSMAFGQLKYSRAKILTNYEGLNLLSNLGIPVENTENNQKHLRDSTDLNNGNCSNHF